MATKECVTKRTTLWFLIFIGCGVNYMIRTNINIAIIAMVGKTNTYQNNSQVTSECIVTETADQNLQNTLNYSLQENNWNNSENEVYYDWDEEEQGKVLGAFFWLYWASQIPGGILARIYGAKIVFGFSNLFICVACFLIPFAASINFNLLLFIRVFQGFVGGFCWPSLNYIIAQWVPPNERAMFVTAYKGSALGAALTYPLCGTIIYLFNWQVAFYVTGALGVIWFISWWFTIYNTPNEHPTITKSELDYIRNSLGNSITTEKLKVPWCKILTSWPLWANIILTWGCLWGLFLLLIHGPSYFQNVHGWSIQTTGLLSGIPQVCRLILALVLSYICDKLLSSKKLSTTSVRKIAGAICNIFQGLCMLGLAFSGCNSVAAVIFFAMATAASGAESPGPIAAYVDLSPNFSSILMGIGNMVSVLPGFIIPAIVGVITYENQTSQQWQKVFWIASGTLLITGIIHLLTSSAKLQEWNTPESKLENVDSPEEAEEFICIAQNDKENEIISNTEMKTFSSRPIPK